MAMYYIWNWKLCYIARNHLPFQSISSGLRRQFIIGLMDRTVIDITQLGCPPLANISLQGISCTFACHKFRHVCAMQTAYSLAQWLNFHNLNLQYAKCPTQPAYHYFVVHSNSTSRRQSTSPSTWMRTSNNICRLELLQAMWYWMTYSGSF